MSDNRVKLSINGMTKKYSNGEGVADIDLTVHEGELVSLLGPSGCGKTTILRVLGGFLKPDKGNLYLDGVEITHLPPEKRPTAMVFQSYNLWPHMTIYENLAFGLRLRKLPASEIKESVARAVALVQIEGNEKKYPSQLSGGQQQRVAIARALLIKPAVLLLDEPFSALDAKIRSQMREELKKIQSDLKITIVFVTHDQEEAMAISNRIVVMNRGGIEQIGTPEEIYDAPSTRFVAEFIGDMNFLQTQEGKVMAVRPENININIDSNGGDNLNGTIETMMVMGHFIEMILNSEKGRIKAFLPRGGNRRFREGDTVSFSIGAHRMFTE